MRRRRFLASLAAAPAALPAHLRAAGSGKLHLVSLSFDDGFRKSFLRIARIYEQFSLSACFNIIASAHMPGNQVRDDYMKQELFGNFDDWNELQDRGHEIMPHGYRHAHLASLPPAEARDLVRRCLDVFSQQLRGFDAKKAVFNFPYNQSSKELEDWLPSVVMAFRAGGGILNPLPRPDTVKITTGGFGPGNGEKYVEASVEKLLAQPSGWLVLQRPRSGRGGLGSHQSRLPGKVAGQAAGHQFGAHPAGGPRAHAGPGRQPGAKIVVPVREP